MGPGANGQPTLEGDSASQLQSETVVIRFDVVATKVGRYLKPVLYRKVGNTQKELRWPTRKVALQYLETLAIPLF